MQISNTNELENIQFFNINKINSSVQSQVLMNEITDEEIEISI